VDPNTRVIGISSNTSRIVIVHLEYNIVDRSTFISHWEPSLRRGKGWTTTSSPCRKNSYTAFGYLTKGSSAWSRLHILLNQWNTRRGTVYAHVSQEMVYMGNIGWVNNGVNLENEVVLVIGHWERLASILGLHIGYSEIAHQKLNGLLIGRGCGIELRGTEKIDLVSNPVRGVVGESI
jgi:hypothetical protein